MPPFMVLSILGLFLVVAAIICYVDDLAPFAPRRTSGLKGPAQTFCLETCRLPDGQCPLAVGGVDADTCPLWRFIDARLSTDMRFNHSLPAGPVPQVPAGQ